MTDFLYMHSHLRHLHSTDKIEMGQDQQTVLRCGQCNKPFDKASTLKRHDYYCRSRKLGRKVIPRARSCATCVKRKTRCDNRRPECSLCAQKGLTCSYPAESTRASTNADRDGRSPDTIEIKPYADTTQDAVHGVDLGLTKRHSSLETAPVDQFDWDELDIAFSDFVNEQMTAQPFNSVFLSQTFVPPVPSGNIRSILARTKPDKRLQRTSQLIVHTLKSYLRMMQHNHELPPFIHPGLASSNLESARMEPMANCMSLMRMINGGVQSSRKLFWKNVRLECERLLGEYAQMTRLELLAALQALSIYIFVRLDEGQTDDNDFDALLLAAVTAIAHQFNCYWRYADPQTGHGTELQSLWQDWVIKESVNRLCVVYRIIDLLAYFEPAAMCDLPSDLLLAPLPARKQLWESTDEFTWHLESNKDLMGESVFGLTADGDLVKWSGYELSLSRSTPCAALGGNKDEANWEEWCSGMDGLGGLVMLAASLVG